MDPSPWLLILLFASQNCAWAEKIRWKERIWSNWLWCTSWIRWEDNWTWYKGRNSAVFWCIFWLKLHAYDWFIHRWLNWSLGMKQIGVGVAVVVFGLVFALGDFLPSGRYDLHKRFSLLTKIVIAFFYWKVRSHNKKLICLSLMVIWMADTDEQPVASQYLLLQNFSVRLTLKEKYQKKYINRFFFQRRQITISWPLILLSFYSNSPTEEATVVNKKLSEEEKTTLQVTLCKQPMKCFLF